MYMLTYRCGVHERCVLFTTWYRRSSQSCRDCRPGCTSTSNNCSLC